MKFPPQITKLPNSSKKGSHRSPKRRRLANGQYEAKPKDQFEASEDRDRLMLDSTEWSCVCATLQQYEELIDKWKKSKDPNEQQMRHYLVKDVIPVIQAAEDVCVYISLVLWAGNCYLFNVRIQTGKDKRGSSKAAAACY